MKKKRPDYCAEFEQYKESLHDLKICGSWRSEFAFEVLRDHSLFGDIRDTLDWYNGLVAQSEMSSSIIPLKDCRGWLLCPQTGSLIHDSGEFFSVDGMRINTSPSREVENGWDQPILTQVGYVGGILGLIRKRFHGVPHYLVEGKAEPGNYNTVQITTTIQATYSNLKRAHRGKETPYAPYFLAPEENHGVVLFEQWMSEDGGRLNNKRNKTMIVEVDEQTDIKLIAPRYRWVSLFQLKSLLATQNAIISPHIRGVLSVV